MPTFSRGEDGLTYVKTAGGNKAAVGRDELGRDYFVDAAGNIYYDTGDPKFGMFVVSIIPRVFF